MLEPENRHGWIKKMGFALGWTGDCPKIKSNKGSDICGWVGLEEITPQEIFPPIVSTAATVSTVAAVSTAATAWTVAAIQMVTAV